VKLFFSLGGRIRRRTFLAGAFLVVAASVALFLAVGAAIGRGATLALYPFAYWTIVALSVKRCHDFGSSGARLFALLIPVLGPLWIAIELAFRRGTEGENRFGPQPVYAALDYLRTPSAGTNVVDDITRLNPVDVAAVVVPKTVEEVQAALRRSSGPVSIGGGRFSMGGQTASPGSLHLDLRELNRVVSVSPAERTVRVQAGARWCDVQRVLDPHDLSVKIMQTYANPTVGGSLSVNCHGRYVGLGPLVLSVRSISIVLADGTLRTAGPDDSPERTRRGSGSRSSLR
jgi:uncharacterized membrane protein YhaH (DUF805 family)